MWLNVDEQRTDWIEKLSQATFKDTITVDESTKRQEIAAGACPVMELRKLGKSNSTSALITSKDCESKARVLCTFELSKPTKVEKKPIMSCLNVAKMTSKNDKGINGRGKRDTKNRMDEQVELKIEGKMFVYSMQIS